MSHQPIEGQLSLLDDVPPVRRCKRCRRILRGDQSIERGCGPRCYRLENDPDYAGILLQRRIDRLDNYGY